MITSMSVHIMRRYRERVTDSSDDNIRNNLLGIYNNAEIIAIYERNNRIIVIKAMGNFVIIGCIKNNYVKLLTCFYENNLERFRKLDNTISGFKYA